MKLPVFCKLVVRVLTLFFLVARAEQRAAPGQRHHASEQRHHVRGVDTIEDVPSTFEPPEIQASEDFILSPGAGQEHHGSAPGSLLEVSPSGSLLEVPFVSPPEEELPGDYSSEEEDHVQFLARMGSSAHDPTSNAHDPTNAHNPLSDADPSLSLRGGLTTLPGESALETSARRVEEVRTDTAADQNSIRSSHTTHASSSSSGRSEAAASTELRQTLEVEKLLRDALSAVRTGGALPGLAAEEDSSSSATSSGVEEESDGEEESDHDDEQGGARTTRRGTRDAGLTHGGEWNQHELGQATRAAARDAADAYSTAAETLTELVSFFGERGERAAGEHPPPRRKKLVENVGGKTGKAAAVARLSEGGGGRHHSRALVEAVARLKKRGTHDRSVFDSFASAVAKLGKRALARRAAAARRGETRRGGASDSTTPLSGLERGHRSNPDGGVLSEIAGRQDIVDREARPLEKSRNSAVAQRAADAADDNFERRLEEKKRDFNEASKSAARATAKLAAGEAASKEMTKLFQGNATLKKRVAAEVGGLQKRITQWEWCGCKLGVERRSNGRSSWRTMLCEEGGGRV